jgi:hypothetical protein
LGGGIDLALAELIAEWRAVHPEATFNELLEFLAHYFSSHAYQTIKWPKSIQERTLTSLRFVERRKKPFPNPERDGKKWTRENSG